MPIILSHLQVNWYESDSGILPIFVGFKISYLFLRVVSFSLRSVFCWILLRNAATSLSCCFSFDFSYDFYFFPDIDKLFCLIFLSVASATPGSSFKSLNSELKFEWSDIKDWLFYKAPWSTWSGCSCSFSMISLNSILFIIWNEETPRPGELLSGLPDYVLIYRSLFNNCLLLAPK